MFSGDYGWIPKKKIKPKVKLFGDDDFKFFIFISIFIFCLAGLVLIITGFYLLPSPQNYQFFAGRDFQAITVFIISLGFCILIGSVIGTYGVFNDINNIIYFYSFFLFCVVTAQISVSMSSYAVNSQIDNLVEERMTLSIKHFEESEENAEAWDHVQSSLSCCGLFNLTDWQTFANLSTIPRSCQRASVPVNLSFQNAYFTDGCLRIVEGKLRNDILLITACCISFVILELLGIAVISSNN